jgi:hypothetical protein
MKKTSKMPWHVRYFADVLESIRLDYRFLAVVLADMTYYFLLALMFLWYLPKFVMPKIVALQAILEQLDMTPQSFPETALPDIQAISISVITHVIIFIVLTLLLYTIIKGLIWAIISRTRPTFGMALKLFGINLGLVALAVLFIYVAPKVFQTNALFFVVVIMFPVVIHFLNISHQMIVMGKGWRSLVYPFSKFHHYVMHYVLILLALFLVVMLVVLFMALSSNEVLSRIFAVASLMLAIIVISWSKFFLYQPSRRL